MKAERAREALAGVLRDKDADVRLQAAFALAALHDNRAVAPLLDYLPAKGRQGDEEFAAARVRMAMAPFADPRAVSAVLTASTSPMEQNMGSWILWVCPDPRATDLLVEHLQKLDTDGLLAVRALNFFLTAPTGSA